MQKELFTESLSEALDSAISQLGGHKRVGLMLWPEKSALEAGKQLANCLNTEHAQKLSLEQIDLIIDAARAKDIHDVHKYLCDRHSYEFKPITKESIRADVAVSMQHCLGQFQSLLSQWEKVKP